jgi:hypothetical protein
MPKPGAMKLSKPSSGSLQATAWNGHLSGKLLTKQSLAVGSVRHYFASSDELLVFSFGAVIDRIAGRLEAAWHPSRMHHRIALSNTMLC